MPPIKPFVIYEPETNSHCEVVYAKDYAALLAKYNALTEPRRYPSDSDRIRSLTSLR